MRNFKVPKYIEGQLLRQEPHLLYELGRKAKYTIVEIGSFKGLSTYCLAKGTLAGNKVKVYAIDPHTMADSYKIFLKNMKKAGLLNKTVIPIRKKSMEAVKGWDKKIGLLWIDGDHSYNSVRKDFEKWTPYLVKGGFIALHDTSDSPPAQLVQERIIENPEYTQIRYCDLITFAKKRPDKKHRRYERARAKIGFHTRKEELKSKARRLKRLVR